MNRIRIFTFFIPALLSFYVSGCASLKSSGNNPDELGTPKGAVEKNINKHLAKGDSEFSLGNLEGALVEYLLALDKDAENADTLFKVGTVHRMQKNSDAAQIAYKRALRIEPEHAGSLEGMGILHLKQEEFEEARNLLEPLADLSPPRWQALSALGILSDMEGRHEEAKSYFEKALEFGVDNPWLHNNLGFSYYLSNDLMQARSKFLEAVEIAPKFNEAWANLGLVYTRLGDMSSANAAFEQVVDEAAAYNNVGYLMYLFGEPENARHEFENAIKTATSYYPVARENLDQLNGSISDSSAGLPSLKVTTHKTNDRPKIIGTKLSADSTATGRSETTGKETLVKSASEVSQKTKNIQKLLFDLGYYTGEIDGILGKNTRAAIKSYKKSYFMADNSEIDSDFLNHIGI